MIDETTIDAMEAQTRKMINNATDSTCGSKANAELMKNYGFQHLEVFRLARIGLAVEKEKQSNPSNG